MFAASPKEISEGLFKTDLTIIDVNETHVVLSLTISKCAIQANRRLLYELSGMVDLYPDAKPPPRESREHWRSRLKSAVRAIGVFIAG